MIELLPIGLIYDLAARFVFLKRAKGIMAEGQYEPWQLLEFQPSMAGLENVRDHSHSPLYGASQND